MSHDAYNGNSGWIIKIHPAVEEWIDALKKREHEKVISALKALELQGPMLGRPFVDHVKGSRFKNMKELRPRGESLRLLFAFDPARQAVILVAGDKNKVWNKWYEQNISLADQRFSEHLKEFE
jgi:hypothetical protein